MNEKTFLFAILAIPVFQFIWGKAKRENELARNQPGMERKRYMLSQRLWIGLVALVTFGSGVINLYSVIGPSLPERRAILLEIFPLEFLHLSRFFTVLSGFALVISSINIYKKKKRAWLSVMLLSASSIIFHLTKGIDYEEATLSLVLLTLLWLTRKNFTVQSNIPDWRWGVMRFGIALLAAFAYGVAGFWLLEPKEFGINFHLSDAIYRTLLFLTLQGDARLTPHTHYAHWFLDSLYLITLTGIGYSLFALFRPVLYRFRSVPHDRALAAEIVGKYSRHALDYFKLWPDKSYFFSPSRQSFIAYRVGANYALALADPVGPEEEMEATIRGFVAFCQEHDWGVAFHQVLPNFLPVYKNLGLRKLKVGEDAIVDLSRFSLEGSDHRELRRKTNHLDKLGYTIQNYAPPVPEEIVAQAKEVSDEWLQFPGRRERGFTLGKFEPHYVRSTPLYAAINPDGKIDAFVNIVPSQKGEMGIDLMRRRAEAPVGIMEYVFVKIIFALKAKGYQRFNMTMAPMSGFQEREEATPEERAIHYFFQHLNFIFNFQGLRQFKAKFASFWEPRYAIYRNALDLPRLALAIREVSEL